MDGVMMIGTALMRNGLLSVGNVFRLRCPWVLR
jgi:hypothetical protein